MAVVLTDLTKAYVAPDGSAVPTIDIPHFELTDGEQVALVGSSGSGKTTLLHLIAGILVPDSGRVTYRFRHRRDDGDGRGDSADGDEEVTELTALSEAERDIFRGRHLGYIFQTHHLLPGFTARENVLLGMSFSGRSPDRAWADHLLEEVGLTERRHYKPAKLSVGQQQRVAVARALAGRPRVVLADEPTGALDATNAQQVLDLIRKLCSDVGASLLLVSHDQALTRQLPRSVALADLNRAASIPAGQRAAAVAGTTATAGQ